MKVPKEVVKDALVQVQIFVFLIDFCILEIKTTLDHFKNISIILSRSFLATSIALVNYRNEVIKLLFSNMAMQYNIFDVGK